MENSDILKLYIWVQNADVLARKYASASTFEVFEVDKLVMIPPCYSARLALAYVIGNFSGFQNFWQATEQI